MTNCGQHVQQPILEGIVKPIWSGVMNFFIVPFEPKDYFVRGYHLHIIRIENYFTTLARPVKNHTHIELYELALHS